MLLEKLHKEFKLDCRIRNLSNRTIETYDRNINIFLNFIDTLDVIELEDVTKSILNAFVIHCNEQGLQPSYINTILKSVKVMLRYATREGYIKEDIALKAPLLKTKQKVMYTFTDKEVAKMIGFYQGHGFRNHRNRLIIEMFADTGIRVSELRGIRNGQIKDGYMIIFGKGNKERVVPLSPYIEKRIVKYKRIKYDYFRNLRVQRELQDFLFLTDSGKRMKSNAMIEIIVKNAAKYAEVDAKVERQSCHSLRHFYAQKMLRNGVNIYSISKFLGHSSLKTTQIYLNSIADEELMAEAVQSTPIMQLIRDESM